MTCFECLLRLRTVLLSVVLLLLVAPCTAETGEDNPAHAALRLFLDRETRGIPGRAEISIGNLDPRLKLAPCSRVEPFLPGGTRVWGKFMIGLRCQAGASWTAYLPVEVRVWGTVLVSIGAFSTGQSLGPTDVRHEEVELTRETGLITSDQQLTNRVLTRALTPGQPLRQDHFRIRPMVSQGDLVRVVYRGTGFTVSSEGRAMGAAQAGQSLRVQTHSGKMIAGILQPGRIVELNP